MWQSRKIKAFTLIEMVVTLLVSTIIFGASYLLLQIVQGSYARMSREQAEVLKVNTLREALSRDFKRSGYVLLEQDGITCYGDSTAVTYLFGEEVIRQVNLSERMDTFYLAVAELSPRLNNQAVLSPGKPVESLSITIVNEQDTFTLYLYHPYSAEERMRFTQIVKE